MASRTLLDGAICLCLVCGVTIKKPDCDIVSCFLAFGSRVDLNLKGGSLNARGWRALETTSTEIEAGIVMSIETSRYLILQATKLILISFSTS